MSATELLILVALAVAAFIVVTQWRKVILLLLSAAIAVFLYGVFDLARAVTQLTQA
ncbi:hypothetical protein [Symbioplanes lichenis]|uniref:hypothetical protein n=1 Tax=Symbioplanes lichenis TaxID=1629072 RepID=UPI0027397375|nr:hypothetical protein [Actinoplanes lichenis]